MSVRRSPSKSPTTAFGPEVTVGRAAGSANALPTQPKRSTLVTNEDRRAVVIPFVLLVRTGLLASLRSSVVDPDELEVLRWRIAGTPPALDERGRVARSRQQHIPRAHAVERKIHFAVAVVVAAHGGVAGAAPRNAD